MDDRIHALRGLEHGRRVGQVADHHLLVRLQVGNLGAVRQPKAAREGREASAQLGAETSGCATDEYRVETGGHMAILSVCSMRATANAMRLIASERISSAVAVEMRKNGESP